MRGGRAYFEAAGDAAGAAGMAAGCAAAGAVAAAGAACEAAGLVAALIGSSGTISSATRLMILISGFTAGPAVSL